MSDDGEDELIRCLAEVRANPGDTEALERLQRAFERAPNETIAELALWLDGAGVATEAVLEVGARALAALERHDERRSLLDKLIALDATAPRLVARAEAALASGRIALAMEDLDRALALKEDAKTLLLRATVRSDNGRFDEARADIARARALGASPIRVETAWLGLTADVTAAGLIEVALQTLDEGIASVPSARMHLMRARFRRDLGDVAGFEADVAAASAIEPELVASDPKWAELRTSPDDELKAAQLRTLGMQPEVMSAMLRANERAAAGDPTAWLEAISHEAIPGAIGHWLRARAAMNADRYALAEREIGAGLALQPDNGELGECYVEVLIRLGDDAGSDAEADAYYRRALSELDRMAAIPWVSYETRFLRAVALNRAGEDGAQAILDALIDEYPERPDAKTIRDAIARADAEADADEARRAK